LGLRYFRDLRNGGCNIYVGLEIHFHDCDADQRLRLNVIDIVDRRRQRAFSLRDDAVGHIHGGEAGVLPHDADHRNINVGKYVGGCIENRKRPKNQQ
jgi:hypothetical protein